MDEWAEFQDAPASAADEWAEFADAPSEGPATSKSKAQPKRRRNIYGHVAGLMANFNRGLYVGDEIAALASTGINALTGDGPQGFRANLDAQRGLEDEYAADHPTASALARGTGNAATVAAPVPNVISWAPSASLGMNAIRGGVASALAASGYSALDRGSLAERANAATNPLTLALGGGVGALAGSASALVGSRLPKVNRQKLRAEKNAAYRAVDNSGVQYRAEPVTGLADVIETELRAANFNPSRHPKTASLLQNEIAGLRGTTPTPTQLDQLRQVIQRDVIKSGDASEQRLGKMMIAQIDDFIGVAGPKQVTAGDPRAAAAAISRARDLNTRVAKIDAVDQAVAKGKRRAGSTGSGGNTDNAIRQNLRSLMEKTPNLTPAEREAFERVIMGTRTQNMLRQVGKLSPQGNGLMFAAHLGAAGMTGGKSAAVAGVGAAAKMAADAMTLRHVDDLVRLIGSGGRDAAPAIRELTQMASGSAELQKAIAGKIAAMAGVGAASAVQAEPIEIDITRSTNPEHLEWRRRQGLD